MCFHGKLSFFMEIEIAEEKLCLIMPSTKHIPDNSVILLFKFENLEERENFLNLSEFEAILGKSQVLALNNNADFKVDKYP